MVCFVLTGCGIDKPGGADYKPPAGGLVSTGDGSMFYIRTPAGDVVIYHNGELSSTTSHDFNPVERTFDYTGALTTGSGAKLFYRYVSTDVDVITLTDIKYNLAEGTMFEMTANADVRQSTAAPEPFVNSHEYLARLKTHFSGDAGR